MTLIFIIIEGILIFCLFYKKVQILSIPLFILGGLGYLIEILEMKKVNRYDLWQISRGGCLLFFEFILFLNFFFHFIDFIYV
jgi:hypothetical protein